VRHLDLLTGISISPVHPSAIERDSIKVGPGAGIGIEIAGIPEPAQKPNFRDTSKAVFLLEIVYPRNKVSAEPEKRVFVW